MGDETSFLSELKVALRKIKSEPGINADHLETCPDKPHSLDSQSLVSENENRGNSDPSMEPLKCFANNTDRVESAESMNSVMHSVFLAKDTRLEREKVPSQDYVDLQTLLKARLNLLEPQMEHVDRKPENKLNNQTESLCTENRRPIPLLNNNIERRLQENKPCNVSCSEAKNCKMNQHNGVNTFVTSTPVTSETNSPHTSPDISLEDGDATVSNALLKANNDRRDSSSNSKDLHDILYEELHFVLKKRTEVKPKVNVDSIRKSKCGKSIVFYGRSPRRKNSDSSSMNSSMGSTNESASPEAFHSPRLGIVRESSNGTLVTETDGYKCQIGNSVPNINASVREGNVSLLRNKFNKIETLFAARNQPSPEHNALKSPISTNPSEVCVSIEDNDNKGQRIGSSSNMKNDGIDELNRIASIVKNSNTEPNSEQYNICSLPNSPMSKCPSHAVECLGETSECSPDSSQSQIEYEPVEKPIQPQNRRNLEPPERVSEIRKVFEKSSVVALKQKLIESRLKPFENNDTLRNNNAVDQDDEGEDENIKMPMLPDGIFKPTCLRIVCKPLDESDKFTSASRLDPQCQESGVMVDGAKITSGQPVENVSISKAHECDDSDRREVLDCLDHLHPQKNVKMNALVNEITECIEKKSIQIFQDRTGIPKTASFEGKVSYLIDDTTDGNDIVATERLKIPEKETKLNGAAKKQYTGPKSTSAVNCKEGSCLCDISDISPIPKTKNDVVPKSSEICPPPVPPRMDVKNENKLSAINIGHRRDHSLPCKSRNVEDQRRDHSLPPIPSRLIVSKEKELTIHIPSQDSHSEISRSFAESNVSNMRPASRSDTTLSSSPDIRILKKRGKPLPPIPTTAAKVKENEQFEKVAANRGTADLNRTTIHHMTWEHGHLSKDGQNKCPSENDMQQIVPTCQKSQDSVHLTGHAAHNLSIVNSKAQTSAEVNGITPSSVSVSKPQPLNSHSYQCHLRSYSDSRRDQSKQDIPAEDVDDRYNSGKHPGSLVSHLVESVRERVGDLKSSSGESHDNTACDSDLDVMESDRSSVYSYSTDCTGPENPLRKSRSSTKLARGKRVYKKRYVSLKDPSESISVTMQNVKSMQSDVSLTTVTSCDNSTSTTDDCCASFGNEVTNKKPAQEQSPRPHDVVGDLNRKSPTEGRRLLYMFGPRETDPCMLSEKQLGYMNDLTNKRYESHQDHTRGDYIRQQQYNSVRNPSCDTSRDSAADILSESVFNTFPMQRSFRRTEREPQDREIIATLMITHTGDRIPPDGAECDLGGSSANQQRIVTVPQPASFHQHGNNTNRNLVDGMYGDVNLCGNRISPARHHPVKNPCRRYKAHYEGSPSYQERGDDSTNGSPVRQRRYLRHQSSFEKDNQKYLLYHTWSSNAARKIKHRGSAASGHGAKPRKKVYDNPVMLDGCDGESCTPHGWESMIHADPRLDNVKRAKYRAQNYSTCHQQEGNSSKNCVQVLDTGFLGCSPNVVLPSNSNTKNPSDSVSVQSVCTYVWDCTDHTATMTTVHVPDNDSSFSTDFGDEFCDAYERSLLDYVRTKDITDIDNEILSIHQQVKAGQRCIAVRRGGLMRKLAKCFICHSHVSSISSHSISRTSSYSDNPSKMVSVHRLQYL